MIVCIRFRTFRPISLVSKNKVLKQNIIGILNLKTRYITGTKESLSNDDVSLTIQHSVNGSNSFSNEHLHYIPNILTRVAMKPIAPII